jgi:hypothetical protein
MILMNVKTEEIIPEVGTVNPIGQVETEVTPPGLQESVVLAMDSFLTLINLFKAEAALALSALPMFVALNITRLPVYLLTWISFAILVATAVYTLTGNLLLTAGAFFVLQLALTFLLERMLRTTREACSLPETRKSMAMAIASVKERFKDEQGHS